MTGVDTNILVHAHRQESPLHKTALSKLQELAEGDEPWALPFFCLGEFLRVVTHPKLFNPPTPMAKALATLNALLDSPAVRVLYPKEDYWEHFSKLCLSGNISGNLVFDGQIAALLHEHGIQDFITEDRDFLRFKRIKSIPL